MHFDPWTLGLQVANFLVLVWLLHRFLYRPVLGIIAARKAATDKLIADAQAEKKAAEDLKQSLESQRAAIAQERDIALKAAGESADAEGKAVLARAHAQAEGLRSEAKKTFERERTQIVRTVGRDAARLAVSIARRLLQEAPAVSVQEGLLDLVCDDVKALPADSKKRIAERVEADKEVLEVVTATPLDKRAATRFRESLSAALGAPATPKFRVDKSLIAGVEIHFPFTILRRSWSEDLKRIEAELNDDDHATKVA
ncbi:MAG TPA: F0F1 ATP synthase subunit delta [Caulobacteraceae bacterium]|nr:F0F1 ATP synthase subunit delta [Caulobacteraceae bacterium]